MKTIITIVSAAFLVSALGFSANAVKRDCPVSQALASVPEITLKAKLR